MQDTEKITLGQMESSGRDHGSASNHTPCSLPHDPYNLLKVRKKGGNQVGPLLALSGAAVLIRTGTTYLSLFTQGWLDDQRVFQMIPQSILNNFLKMM